MGYTTQQCAEPLRASDGFALGTFALGTNPVGVAFDGANIWVANLGNGTVSKLYGPAAPSSGDVAEGRAWAASSAGSRAGGPPAVRRASGPRSTNPGEAATRALSWKSSGAKPNTS